MSKELFVTSTPHETKLAIVEDDQVVEVYFERENEYTLAGSIYKGKVTRVLPGMQSAFVEIGLERDAFLYVTDFVEGVEEDHDDEEIVAKSGGQQSQQPQREGGRRDERRRGGRGGDQQHRRREDRRDDSRGNRQPRSASAVPQGQPIEFGGDFTGDEIDANEQTELEVANALTESTENGETTQSLEGGEPATRRWRGRRGRRRRGGNREDQQEQQAAPQTSEDQGVTEEPTSFGEDFTAEPEETFAEAETSHVEEQAAAPAREERSERPQRHERPERPDRSERDRSHRPDRSERSERHESPASGRTLLPGESLKKYGGGTEESKSSKPQPAANTVTPRPSTLVNDPSAFMLAGGALAGETIRKYRDRPAQETPAAETHSSRHEEVADVHPAASEPEVQAGAPEHSAEPIAPEEPKAGGRYQRHRQARIEARAKEPAAAVEAHEESQPVTQEQFESPPREVQQEQGSGHYNFSPGAGEVEEEEIDEEEQEFGSLDGMADEPEFEELEEETLDPAEEPSREDEMIAAGDKIAAAFAEAKRAEQQSEF